VVASKGKGLFNFLLLDGRVKINDDGLMESLAVLDTHRRDVAAHDPLPLGEHGNHSPADFAAVAQNLLPLGRKRALASAVKQVEEGMCGQQATHVRVGGRVIEDHLHVNGVGGAQLGLAVFIIIPIEVSVDGIDGCVFDTDNPNLTTENVQAQAARKSVLGNGKFMARGKTYKSRTVYKLLSGLG